MYDGGEGSLKGLFSKFFSGLFSGFCFVRSFVRSFVRAFVRSFVRSFVGSFVRSCVRSFVRSCKRTCAVHIKILHFSDSFVQSCLGVGSWAWGGLIIEPSNRGVVLNIVFTSKPPDAQEAGGIYAR